MLKESVKNYLRAIVLVMNLVTVIQNFNNIFLECHVLNIKKQRKLLTVLFNLNSFLSFVKYSDDKFDIKYTTDQSKYPYENKGL